MAMKQNLLFFILSILMLIVESSLPEVENFNSRTYRKRLLEMKAKGSETLKRDDKCDDLPPYKKTLKDFKLPILENDWINERIFSIIYYEFGLETIESLYSPLIHDNLLMASLLVVRDINEPGADIKFTLLNHFYDLVYGEESGNLPPLSLDSWRRVFMEQFLQMKNLPRSQNYFFKINLTLLSSYHVPQEYVANFKFIYERFINSRGKKDALFALINDELFKEMERNSFSYIEDIVSSIRSMYHEECNSSDIEALLKYGMFSQSLFDRIKSEFSDDQIKELTKKSNNPRLTRAYYNSLGNTDIDVLQYFWTRNSHSQFTYENFVRYFINPEMIPYEIINCQQPNLAQLEIISQFFECIDFSKIDPINEAIISRVLQYETSSIIFVTLLKTGKVNMFQYFSGTYRNVLNSQLISLEKLKIYINFVHRTSNDPFPLLFLKHRDLAILESHIKNRFDLNCTYKFKGDFGNVELFRNAKIIRETYSFRGILEIIGKPDLIKIFASEEKRDIFRRPSKISPIKNIYDFIHSAVI